MQTTIQLPHDIESLTPFSSFWRSEWLWGAILALLVVVLIYYLLKRLSKSEGVTADSSRQKTLQERIRETFCRIESLPVPEPFTKADQEEFFFTLSMLFREYVELCTSIPATGLTSRELKAPFLEKLPMDRDTIQTVLGFFAFADNIKFSKQQTTSEEARRYIKEVVEWLRQIKPPSKPEEEGAKT